VIGAADLVALREAHPLAHVFPLLYDVLGQAAEACDSIMAITDAEGRLLWVTGPRPVVSRAEGIGFVEGALWDEAHAGTNAPGTALQIDRAVQIHAAEHTLRPVHAWSCAAAPIHDPVTHAILGVVDVTGGDEVAWPQTMGLIRAAARMAEAELGRLAVVRRHAVGPDGRTVPAESAGPAISVAALGRPDCLVQLRGRTVRLSPRHSEILVLLADHDGLTGNELAVQLSPDHLTASTLRAELTRLRGLLGDVLDSRPYRIRGRTEGDWRSVSALLTGGRLDDAVRAYRGPLLPQSQAPGIVDRRDSLTQQLRGAVLASQRPELMVAWTRSRWGADDAQMWRAQVGALPQGSPLRPLAAAEADRLETQLL
jgi:hypothetical protein